MTIVVLMIAHCDNMALKCRAWGFDEAARAWALAADSWRALDELMMKLTEERE